jgi:hypothetical protein
MFCAYPNRSIVAAMRSPSGASAAILRTARQGRITLLVSVPLALEYEAICSEAEHRLAAGLGEREVEIFLDAVVAMAEPMKTRFYGGRNCEILAMRWCWKRRSMGAPTHWSHSTCGTLGPCLRDSGSK